MKSKEKWKKSDIAIAVIVIAIAIAVVVTLVVQVAGIFNDSGNETTQDSVRKTTVEKLIAKNLDVTYPQTPTRVVDMYASIAKEIHSKDTTDKQVRELFSQMRKLFDDELLANNEYAKHSSRLEAEVAQYREEDISIVRYTVEDLKDIKYYEVDGVESTRVGLVYSIRKGSGWVKSNEQVILRKDDDGRWKIYGVEQVKTVESEENE